MTSPGTRPVGFCGCAGSGWRAGSNRKPLKDPECETRERQNLLRFSERRLLPLAHLHSGRTGRDGNITARCSERLQGDAINATSALRRTASSESPQLRSVGLHPGDLATSDSVTAWGHCASALVLLQFIATASERPVI
ncbi:hypothetical protein SKAU_G00042260 [Synaphobranchus kaupii]|uniref:Uncharacterized protein n=1 Tax=Synaphobranchus kaupii TaxID=118154 RepID=A0A9Q1G1R9_SYNKA|nr:hypothetical protein SKAU_G00042260 [Synaphobranchus kaupii]